MSRLDVHLGQLGAECLGAAALTAVGLGAQVQTVLGAPPVLLPVAWGVSLGLGVYLTGPISGGHLNPAITVLLAAVGKFPWRMAPFYLAAQIGGAVLGALALALLTRTQLDAAVGFSAAGRAAFTTTPPDHALLALAWAVCGAVVLVLVVYALVEHPRPGPPTLLPPVIAATITVIGWAAGPYTMLNPATDLAGRAMVAIGGYPAPWDAWWAGAFGPILAVGIVYGATVAARRLRPAAAPFTPVSPPGFPPPPPPAYAPVPPPQPPVPVFAQEQGGPARQGFADPRAQPVYWSPPPAAPMPRRPNGRVQQSHRTP